MNVIGPGIILHYTIIQHSFLFYLVSQAVAYLLYPLLGWLADVYFTRYKFVLFSFITMMVAAILMIVTASLLLKFPQYHEIYTLGGLSVIGSLIGMGLFESTAIQFGIDQMVDPTSIDFIPSTFVRWYYWACNLGQLVILCVAIGVQTYFSQCTIKVEVPDASDYDSYLLRMTFTAFLFMAAIQLVCACVGLCLLVRSKRHLNTEQMDEHPLKLFYRVLRYAWEHTRLEYRSAFTYWSAKPPSRIDFGKNEHGGPFSTKEVEDTKLFLFIFLLLLSLLGFHLSGHGYSLVDHLMRRQCPSYWVMVLVGDPMHITILTVIIGVPVYQWIIVRCCQNCAPSMCKRMGLGLLCCLIKNVIEVVVHATMARRNHCKPDKTFPFASCFALQSEFDINGTCSSVTEFTNDTFFCDESNTPFLLLILINVLQGLSFLLVFMTALQFICVQATFRMKGPLIGLWYALLAVGYLLVEVPETFITDSATWEIFNEVKAFLIFLSLMVYVCVFRRYCQYQRDMEPTLQFMVEEVFSRRMDQEERERRPLLHSFENS